MISMKVGALMKEYTLGLYEKSMPSYLTWEEKFNCAKECGFDAIEISIDETEEKLSRLDMSKGDKRALIELMFKSGVEIRTLCLSGHRKYPLGSLEEAVRTKGMDIMKKAIEFSNDLGIKIIQLAGYDVYYEEGNEQTKKYFEENLKKAVEMAASKGVILAFETMETEFMNTVKKAMEFVKLVDSPYLQIYPDCGNVTNATVEYGSSVLEDFENGKGHIAAVHLKETVPGKFREITFGTGHVNFEEIIKKSWELGVRKFTAEFWYTGNDDWKEVIKDTKNFMDEKFKKALS